MASDLIPPVPDDPSFGFVLKNWLFKMRRNVNQFAIDISTLVTEIAQAISPTNPLTSGNIATYVNTQTISNNYVADGTLTGTKLASATITGSNIAGTTITDSNIVSATITGAKIANSTITDANISSLNADKITAGTITGINVNSSSHTTKGSYLTSATTSGDTTVNVKDTSTFASSGTAIIIDPSNDRDSFTYTNKTATTLTGCSGVGTHGNERTIIPLTSVMVIDENTNEMRFYGNRGDAVFEELAAVGITSNGSDTIIGSFGSSNAGCTHIAVFGQAYDNVGIQGQSVSSYGMVASSTSGGALIASSVSGFGITALGNTTKAHMYLPPLAGRPSNKDVGAIAVINTTGGTTDNRTGTPKLMMADGTDWRLVEDYSVWTG